MRQIHDPAQVRRAIEAYGLETLFSQDLAAMGELYQFEKKEYLMCQGAIAARLYLLLSGSVKVFQYTVSGKTHCQQYFNSLEILGETDALWGIPCVGNVVALTDCLCLGISLERYGAALRSDLTFLRHVAQVLARRLAAKSEHTLLEPLELRLAAFMLRVRRGDRFELSMQETAKMLDSSYRHLQRVIYAMCRMHLLAKTDYGYQILNLEALEALARGQWTLGKS